MLTTPNDAVAVKDRIWSMLNESDSAMDFCNKAESVMFVLKMTDGLWNELNYAYKAREIVTHISSRLFAMSGTCQHHQTHLKIESVKEEANRMALHFYNLQYA